VCTYMFVWCCGMVVPVVNLLGRSVCWVAVSCGKMSYANSVGHEVITPNIHCHHSQCVMVTVSSIHSGFHSGLLQRFLLSCVYLCYYITFNVRCPCSACVSVTQWRTERGGFGVFNPPPLPEIPKISAESSIA